MRRIVISLFLGACIAGSPGVVLAKKKTSSAGEVKKEKEGKAAPNDKSANDGAQGRRNATEDAAAASDGRDNSYHNPR
jgi:hypothetical protein